MCGVQGVKEKRLEGWKKKKKKTEVLGFVCTAGKSAESGENGQRQRDCVCVGGGISLYSSVTKEAPRASHGQVWASICFGAVRKNYMNHWRDKLEAYIKRFVLFTRETNAHSKA